MPKYRCLKQFWHGGRIHAVGDVVDYDGLPSSNLDPLDKDGRERRVEAEAVFERQRQEARLAQSESGKDLMAAMFMAFESVQAKRPAGRKPEVAEEVHSSVAASDQGKTATSRGRSHSAE